jgi:hypothetical protein
VQATDTVPNAVLTLVGYGTMTYNARSKVYSYQVKTSAPPTSVTVNSNLGGTATKTVTVK